MYMNRNEEKLKKSNLNDLASLIDDEDQQKPPINMLQWILIFFLSFPLD